MIRRIASFVAAAVVASTLAVSATPAGATHQHCTGRGDAQTGVGITLTDPWASTFKFTIDASASVCLGGQIEVNGSGSGTGCIASTGSGTVSGGTSGTVTYSTVGPVLVATGAIVGAAIILPDALKGSDCLGVLGPNAKDFVLVGAEFATA